MVVVVADLSGRGGKGIVRQKKKERQLKRGRVDDDVAMVDSLMNKIERRGGPNSTKNANHQGVTKKSKTSNQAPPSLSLKNKKWKHTTPEMGSVRSAMPP